MKCRCINARNVRLESLNELQIYNCDECSFGTKYIRNLRKHMKLHKSLNELQMFKCEMFFSNEI